MSRAKVHFQELSGRYTHQVCEEAAEFATKVGQERLIDISHSAAPPGTTAPSPFGTGTRVICRT